MRSKKSKTHTEGNNPLTDTGKIRLKEINKSNNVRSYLYAIVSIFIIGTLGAVMVLYLRPESDPVIVFPISLGLTGTTILALLGFIKTVQTDSKLDDVKNLAVKTEHTMNSSLSEMLKIIKAGYKAEGFLEGQFSAEAKEDKRIADRVAERKAAKKK